MSIGMRTVSVPIFVIQCDGENCNAELAAFSKDELQELVDGHSWHYWIRPEKNFTSDNAGDLEIAYHICPKCDDKLCDDPEWLKARRQDVRIVGKLYEVE